MLDDEGKEKAEETKRRIRGHLNLEKYNDSGILLEMGKNPEKLNILHKRKRGRPSPKHLHNEAINHIFIAKWREGLPFSNNNYYDKSGDAPKNKNKCIEWAVQEINVKYELTKKYSYSAINRIFYTGINPEVRKTMEIEMFLTLYKSNQIHESKKEKSDKFYAEIQKEYGDIL
jgi:hypothetical protein